jgi:predicted metal-dependent hydrolase
MPQFRYRDEAYSYQLTRSGRKTLGIYVHPDLRIEVRAPEDAPEQDIQERVHKRRGWIVKQWKGFLAYHPRKQAPVYRNGATHLYLGRQYRLRIQQGPKNTVKLMGGHLEVTYHPESTPERALQAWYRERADYWFAEVLDTALARFRNYDLPQPSIIHKRLQKRWGSCKVSKERILLNTDLIQGPKVGIEYVIVHELVHLLHAHHTAAFYATLDSVLPDWKEWKEKLEGVMA